MAKKRWVTPEMVALISGLGCKVEVMPPGGDVDTSTLHVTAEGAAEGHNLHIAGFTPGNYEIENPDDAEVEMIEITDGQDSRGGLNSDDDPTADLYHKIRKTLRKLGWTTVDQMKDYF
jgi:hypothetical protein